MRGKVSFPWSSVVAFGGEVCIRGRGQRGADSKLKLGGRRRPKTGLLENKCRHSPVKTKSDVKVTGTVVVILR